MIYYNKNIFRRCFAFRPRYWYKNLKMIPSYIRQMHHLIKHGYDEYASWQIYDWFINTMKPILHEYRDSHYGVPIIIDNYETDNKEKIKENEIKWDKVVDRMIFLLGEMDEFTCQKKNPYEEEWDKFYDDCASGKFSGNEVRLKHESIGEKYCQAELDLEKYRDECKEEFFKLFSKYFWNLWD